MSHAPFVEKPSDVLKTCNSGHVPTPTGRKRIAYSASNEAELLPTIKNEANLNKLLTDDNHPLADRPR